jgi:hypothetical protein
MEKHADFTATTRIFLTARVDWKLQRTLVLLWQLWEILGARGGAVD